MAHKTSLSTLEIPPPRQLTVLGAGLLGASVLRAAAQHLPGTTRVAWSRSASSRAAAAEWARVETSPDKACAGSDLVIAACPVDALPELLQSAREGISLEAVVTDVGSTKRGAHAAATHLRRPSRFIGSHPMAGSEKGGSAESRPDLFVGRPCILTLVPETEAEAEARVAAFWVSLGAQVHRMTPVAHDAALAEISHLPHATAAVLAALLAGRRPRTELSAGGLRDTTRIAAGDPTLWVPILLENADNLAPLLEELASGATRLRKALQAGDSTAVRQLLEEGRRFRRSL